MANRPKSQRRSGGVMEYQNDDLAPVYVESVQGVATSRGSLQMMFFSDYVSHHKDTPIKLTQPPDQPPGTLDVQSEDPFRFAEQDIRIVRRVEANLIMTLPALKALVPWLQLKIQELESKGTPEVR